MTGPGLPTLMSAGDTLGPAISKIAGSIGKLLDPYKDIETDVRNNIAKNPKIAEQLADLEYTNPGMLAKIYGPNVSQYAQSLRPSVEAKIAKAKSGALDTALKDPANVKYLGESELGFHPSDIQKEDISTQKMTALQALMAAHPELAAQSTFKDLMGTSQIEYEDLQAKKRARETTQANFEGAWAGLKPSDIIDAIQGDHVKGPNGQEIKINPADALAMFQSPMGPFFTTMMSERLADKRQALQIRMQQAQDATSFNRGITLQKAGNAAKRATEIEGEVTPAATAAAMYGPDDPSVIALGGTNNPKDAGYERFQAEITKAKEAIKAEGKLKNVQRLKAAQGNIVQKQAQLAKMETAGASEDEMQNGIADLNVALDEASGITGRTVVAKYVKDPQRWNAGVPGLNWIGSAGLHYFDENGIPIKEESVPSYVAGTGIKIPKLNLPPHPAPGHSGSGTKADSTKVTTPQISSESIFPNADPALHAQLNRISKMQAPGDKKKYYTQILAQNPNMTESQKSQLKSMFGL